MPPSIRGFSSCSWVAVVLVALVGLPEVTEGAWLGFRNDTDIPVVVQGSCVVNKVTRRTKPHLLFPGEVCWDRIIQPGNKLILIYDAKHPNQVLYNDTIGCGSDDVLFSLQFDPSSTANVLPAKLIKSKEPSPR